jgi:hypothetical protein
MHNELEEIWKAAVVASLRYYPRFSSEELSGNTEHHIQLVDAPAEVRKEALPEMCVLTATHTQKQLLASHVPCCMFRRTFLSSSVA